MPITLTPEQEAIVIADAKASGFENVEVYLEDRLSSLHAEEVYFAANREEFDRLIEEGLASADRGELYTPEEVKEELAAFKREYVSRRSAA